MTPKTMRSQLSGLEKLDMGRVRRRTSRKARSMTLVVRTLIQWACGTAKKFRSASRSRSTQVTALGRRCCQCCFQSFAAVADDQLQSLALQTAKKKILQELLPGRLALIVGELVGQHATQAGAGHSVSH